MIRYCKIMAKKNIASLMNGLMGEPASAQESDFEQESVVTQEMKDNLEKERKKNVGRPPKGKVSVKEEEIRATFIVNPEIIRKLKYISLVESNLLKNVISEALTKYIDEWETDNGKIRLPKRK